MNKISILIIIFFFFNNCSLNENSKIWKDKNRDIDFINQDNIKKLFVKDEIIKKEFNPELSINITKISNISKTTINRNDYGSQNYNGFLEKEASYPFAKLDDINVLDFKPAFLSDGLIFFDKKGTIIRYNNDKKIIWKKNYYTKAEKKLKPKLYFAIDNETLLVADDIAKYYSININTGELNWSNNSTYPFNSEIKKYKKKFFVIDYKNTLRCYDINDGSECWNMQTED